MNKSTLKNLKVEEKRYFKNAKPLNRCPICGAKDFREVFKRYVQCNKCTHVFVRQMMSSVDIYKKNSNYHDYYMDNKDKHLLVARRKLARVLEITDGDILDIGAGCGYFGYVCKQAGIKYTGVEIGEKARIFSEKELNVKLLKSIPKKHFQTCTLWGVLEHIQNPYEILDSINVKHLFIEVPRWRSVSTIIQIASGQATRHLVPQRHLHMFTDESLRKFLEKNEFKVIKDWYFGKDVTEIFDQTGVDLSDREQQIFDNAKLSDFLTIVGEKNDSTMRKTVLVSK